MTAAACWPISHRPTPTTVISPPVRWPWSGSRPRGPTLPPSTSTPSGTATAGAARTATMVERLRRHGSTRRAAPGGDRHGRRFPRAVGRRGRDDLPTWVGELYLEGHRATLTTHADVKLANRRGEEALRSAELWSVAASLDRRPDLDRAWKLLLLHQFHDILPGSSIHWVYEDARASRPRCSPSLARSLPRPRPS